MKVNLCAEIEHYDLCVSLLESLDNAGIVAFVKQLDDVVADWDVTRDLRDYFVSEMAKFETEG